MAKNGQHSVTSPFTAQNFKEFPNWIGEYEESIIDCSTTPLQAKLLYHVVIVTDDVDRWLLFVPQYWVDMLSQHILYPHPTFNVCGKYPQQWGELPFNRRRFPTTQFVEYPIEDFITSTPVEFEAAKKLIKEVEASFLQEEENVEEIDSIYKSPGYYCESSVLLSPEVRKAQELETTGEINDDVCSGRPSSLLQQQLTTYNHSSHQMSRKESEYRRSVSSSLSRASSVFSPGLTSKVNKIVYQRGKSLRDGQSNSAPHLSHSKDHQSLNGLKELPIANMVATKPSNSITKVQVPFSAMNSSQGVVENLHSSGSATTIVAQQTLSNSVEQARRPRLPSENDESAYRAKVLKLMGRAVQLLEEQRNPKIIQERIVTENSRHFEEVLKSNVRLPLTTTSQIEDLNSSLINIELSVAMCCVFIGRLKSIASRDQVAKSVMSAVLTKQLCVAVQWKKRGNDKRPMIGHMVNLIAVFAVIIKNVLQINNQPDYSISKLIPVIQQARRALAFESANKEMEESEQNCDAAVQRADRQTQVEIDQRINDIQEAIVNFRISH